MARVNVDQKAFTDNRFVRLGTAIGADRWAAIGRMVLVWDACQEHGSHTLSRDSVNAIHADISNLADVLIACELARETTRGIYIAGAKERTGWLAKARKNGTKGASHGTKGGRPKITPHGVIKKPPVGFSEKPPLTPAPAIDIVSKEKEETESTRLVTELTARGLSVKGKAQLKAIHGWSRKYGAPAVLAAFDANADRVLLANNPAQYLAAILSNHKDGNGKPAGTTGRNDSRSAKQAPRDAQGNVIDDGLLVRPYVPDQT